jgi:cyclopropane-fatty-acyl-phospholipid synthase
MTTQTGSLAIEPPWRRRLPWHQRRLLEQLARLRRGSLEVCLGDNQPIRLQGAEPGPAAAIRIRRPAALLRRVAWRGDLGFGEAYVAGDWDSEDPARLLELLARNMDALSSSDARSWLVQALVGLRHRLRRNSRRGSRRNIAAHYDLGNEFYAQWLDASMTYSAALFQGDEALEAAQARKYARMLELVDPAPGAHILEIGCGWGGFAEFAARRGFRVTGLTLSAEQLEYARARIARAGLGERVELRLQDYRDFAGEVDHVVSIEMFEAVGRDYWDGYFATLARCLRPGGRAALQVITIDEAQFEHYAANPGGFIQTYVFPGGMLPTRTHLERLATVAGLVPGPQHAFGIDYAETLAHWHRAFLGATDWLEANGYDERFRRLWRYYLAFCEAGFRAGDIDVVQLALTRP